MLLETHKSDRRKSLSLLNSTTKKLIIDYESHDRSEKSENGFFVSVHSKKLQSGDRSITETMVMNKKEIAETENEKDDVPHTSDTRSRDKYHSTENNSMSKISWKREGRISLHNMAPQSVLKNPPITSPTNQKPKKDEQIQTKTLRTVNAEKARSNNDLHSTQMKKSTSTTLYDPSDESESVRKKIIDRKRTNTVMKRLLKKASPDDKDHMLQKELKKLEKLEKKELNLNTKAKEEEINELLNNYLSAPMKELDLEAREKRIEAQELEYAAKYKSLELLELHNSMKKVEIEQKDLEIAAKNKEIEALNSELKLMATHLKEKHKQHLEVSKQLTEALATINSLETAVEEKTKELNEKNSFIASLSTEFKKDNEISKLQSEISRKTSLLEQKEQLAQDILKKKSKT